MNQSIQDRMRKIDKDIRQLRKELEEEIKKYEHFKQKQTSQSQRR